MDIVISSKKRLLEFIADQVSGQFQLAQTTLYCNLLNRERLGSTGLGRGFAVPHARLQNLQTAIGLFIKLDQPIHFEAPDNQPVDLVFAVIIPEQANDEYLQTLSVLARVFSQVMVCESLRNATSSDEVVKLIHLAEQ